MTVLDVVRAQSRKEHVGLVLDLARGAWGAWASHHAAVKRLAAECLQGSTPDGGAVRGRRWR